MTRPFGEVGAGHHYLGGGVELTLDKLLVSNQVMRHAFVVVPTELMWSTGVPADVHRSNWIPQLDERPRACGESRRLTDVDAEVWCLRPEGHRRRHW